ncbi:ATP-dependent Clp protease proteolytic subunit [Fuerstiella marisgermanici]|uniref:Clp protease n=1 Tax=Fuerstiella marisgermanici TaxID=1891926 RepID=A0A1P8WM53_9PLAN|nr:ATP-dependent Clp protease proteolytic subunit [Fuerstiella marisgermanici]APZ95127.1 Clp protease [Fuerstiella marisgermanici]
MADNENARKLRPYPSPSHIEAKSHERQPWEVTITGDVGDRQSDLLARLVDVPLRSKGVIYFDSGGGSVYAGLALATLIRTRELRATAVVVGECSSAALMPFAACEKRFVTPFSTMLFHPMRWQSEEDVRLEEATEWARHFKQLEGDLDGLLAKLFPMDAALLETWTRPGRFVSGKELAEHDLAKLFDPFELEKPWQEIR